MPRIRTLKPEIFQSPQVMNLSIMARLLFIGLITQADDEGRGSADPRKLRAVIFPGDDDINAPRLAELLAEIERERLATFYTTEEHGKVYILVSWKRHQSIDKPRSSNIPPPPRPIIERSTNGSRQREEHSAAVIDTRAVAEVSPTSREGSDLKDRKDLKGSLRAHASDPCGLAALEEKTRKLSAAGMSSETILKALAMYAVTAEQIRGWLSTPPPAVAETATVAA